MIKTCFSSNSSTSHSSISQAKRSIHSIHPLQVEEEEENKETNTLFDDSESLSQLIQETKKRNQFQKENVQLKQQILNERQKFEEEKNILIQNDISSREKNQKINLFIDKLSQIVGLSSSDPKFENVIISRLTINKREDLPFQDKENESKPPFNFDQESLKLKDQRIYELEAAIHEGQLLIRSMEEEIDHKINEKNEIQEISDEQQQKIDDLNSIVRQFMVAAEVTDSPENAVRCIQEMKRKFRRIDSLSETAKIDELMKQFEERRANEYGRIYQQIEEQGHLIHNAIESLQANIGSSGAHESSGHSMEIYQTLQNTNKLLAERMSQLRGKMFSGSGISDNIGNKNYNDEHNSREFSKAEIIQDNSEKYDKKGLGPSIWIAKTREMLSLERQLLKANQRLENANRNCQCLANENQYYHFTTQSAKFTQKPMPATLL